MIRSDCTNKIILHIDFDMFFAAVELLDNPKLRSRPLVVANNHGRGIVTTATYEARKYGIGSGTPIEIAKRKCPNLTFIRPHMEKYEGINRVFRHIIYEYTDVCEFVALDEAYLDITNTYEFHSSPEQLAINLQKEIYRKTGCTCSVGLGYNKISAKLASESRKPNGFGKIKDQASFLNYTKELELTKMNGIGSRMAERLYKLFYRETLGELRELSVDELKFYLGKPGISIYNMIRGIDDRVIGKGFIREGYASRKTFQKDLFGREEVLENIVKKIDEASWVMKEDGKSAYTVSLIIRYSEGFKRITRNKTLKVPVKEPLEILNVVRSIADTVDLEQHIRQIGVRLSKTTIHHSIYQLAIGESESFERKQTIYRLTKELKYKFGRDVIHNPI